MHLHTLKAFRHEIYSCFGRARDALFNLVDALLSEDRAQSFPELSLSPHFERRWPSLYEALEDGRIEQNELQKVFVKHVPLPVERSLRIAVDASSIARPKAVTSADRSAQHVHNLPECDKPVTPSSATYILENRRVTTETTALQVAYTQLSELAPQLPTSTIVLMDRGYDSDWLWCKLSTLPLKGTLIRLKGKRCFYRPAPPPTGKRGAPRKRGDKLQPADPTTHADPSGSWNGHDALGKAVRVTWWQHLTLQHANWLELSVIRVERPQAGNTRRDPRISWFVWVGDQHADLVAAALSYVYRFSHEHGYRFDKQSLLWKRVRVRTPEQFERWSLLVAIVHNLLVLSSALVEPSLHPWENRHRVPSMQQVRRGMNKLLPQLGTPAHPPQPRGKSPGRAKGATIRRAERLKVVRKAPKVPIMASS